MSIEPKLTVEDLDREIKSVVNYRIKAVKKLRKILSDQTANLTKNLENQVFEVEGLPIKNRDFNYNAIANKKTDSCNDFNEKIETMNNINNMLGFLKDLNEHESRL